jgi:integrase/recombinase XerD
MTRHASNRQIPRVNILKKINVNGAWKLLPAVLEPNGKLKDKVRIGGAIETHPEGTYYIEWWEGPKRKR